MNIRAYTFTGAIVISAVWLATSPRLHAQTTFTIPFKATETSPASTFTIDSFGTLSETAPSNTSATFTFASTPQMVWLPALAAFRAGVFSGSQTTIGQYSTAFVLSTASGFCSFAAGDASIASGGYSTALGTSTVASGLFSTAIGYDTLASNTISTAEGYGTTASAYGSTALGFSTTASGGYSTATGYSTGANSLCSFVTGIYNTGLSSTGASPNTGGWVATDPLFEVGNGTSTSAKSDALVVYKNGNMTAQGVITAAPGGDIPMYNGN